MIKKFIKANKSIFLITSVIMTLFYFGHQFSQKVTNKENIRKYILQNQKEIFGIKDLTKKDSTLIADYINKFKNSEQFKSINLSLKTIAKDTNLLNFKVFGKNANVQREIITHKLYLAMTDNLHTPKNVRQSTDKIYDILCKYNGFKKLQIKFDSLNTLNKFDFGKYILKHYAPKDTIKKINNKKTIIKPRLNIRKGKR